MYFVARVIVFAFALGLAAHSTTLVQYLLILLGVILVVRAIEAEEKKQAPKVDLAEAVMTVLHEYPRGITTERLADKICDMVVKSSQSAKQYTSLAWRDLQESLFGTQGEKLSDALEVLHKEGRIKHVACGTPVGDYLDDVVWVLAPVTETHGPWGARR